MSQIQSVLFNVNYWTLPTARTWLMKHHLHPLKKVDITHNYYHYRIKNPKQFKRLRTIKTHDNLDLIIGFK